MSSPWVRRRASESFFFPFSNKDLLNDLKDRGTLEWGVEVGGGGAGRDRDPSSSVSLP